MRTLAEGSIAPRARVPKGTRARARARVRVAQLGFITLDHLRMIQGNETYDALFPGGDFCSPPGQGGRP